MSNATRKRFIILRCKWCKKIINDKNDKHSIVCGMEFEVVTMTGHAWGNDRILTFLKEGRRLYENIIQKSSDRSFPPPRFISCWISEKCNLDCTYCFFSDTNHDKSHMYIDAPKFCQWLEAVKRSGSESLEFSGGGEPTLHPLFQSIYSHAHRLGYKLGIITHACNPMPLEDMVNKFSYIRCGLDAATAETHDAIKRNKRKNYWFHQAIENINEIVRLRDSLKTKSFMVGIKVVLNTINYPEIRKMIEMARGLKVNYIQFKQEHSSDHALDDSQQILAQGILSEGMDKNKWHFTQVKGTLFHQRALVKCFMSPIHTVVTATGKILQCCFFESRPIGTIFQPFSEVWGGDEHRRVIDMTTVEECDKVDCRWHVFNSKMRDVIEDPLAQTSFI